MKTLIWSVAIASTLAMTQCTNSSENRVNDTQEEIVEDIKSEKAEIAMDLRQIRYYKHDRLDKVSKELEKGEVDARKDLDDLKDRLTKQRDKVEKELDQITNSSDETWDDIQQSARNTAGEMKLEFEKLGERIDVALRGDNDNLDRENK
jgi:DNA anti-recombination protein RmuC